MMRSHLRLVLSPITGQLERVPNTHTPSHGETRADSPSALVNRGQLAIPFTFPERDSKRSFAPVAQVRP